MEPRKIILLIIIIIYTRPLLYFRYKYRSTVYREKNWSINIKPWFYKDIKGLFSNKLFKNKEEIKIANFYRLYLIGFIALGIIFKSI